MNLKKSLSLCTLAVFSVLIALQLHAQNGPEAAELSAETLREQMVREIRNSSGITDNRILSSLGEVPRHRFIDDEYLRLAYTDTYLPGPGGAVLPSPSLLSAVLNRTNPRRTYSVLVIGENTGYTAALFSRLSARVTCIEFRTVLYERYRSVFRELGYDNITLTTSTTLPEFLSGAPFDIVFVHGAVTRLPEEIIAKCKPSGTVVFPLALSGGFQVFCVLERNGSAFSLEAFQSSFFRIINFF